MPHFAKLFLIIFIAIFCTTSYAKKIEQGHRFRALIIGVDGLRGEQFNQRVFVDNKAPHFKSIAEHGQYAACTSSNDPHCARTHLGARLGSDYAWVTASGWGTVLTGVNADKHLIKNNDYENQAVFYQTSHHYPTFLSRLKQQGFITAVGGVGNFLTSQNGNDLAIGIVDFECGLNPQNKSSVVPVHAASSCNVDYRQSFSGYDGARDDKLTQWLLEMINNKSATAPDLIMGVYDTVDGAGHHYGYRSHPGYMEAISRIDSDVGLLLNAIQHRIATTNEVWLVIVTSDHGGHTNPDGGGSHNNVKIDDEVIPLVFGVFGNNINLLHRGTINGTNSTQMDVSPSLLNWFSLSPAATDGVIRSQYCWGQC